MTRVFPFDQPRHAGERRLHGPVDHARRCHGVGDLVAALIAGRQYQPNVGDLVFGVAQRQERQYIFVAGQFQHLLLNELASLFSKLHLSFPFSSVLAWSRIMGGTGSPSRCSARSSAWAVTPIRDGICHTGTPMSRHSW
ncbi:hypothetical protein [Mycolicibacterium goodii]|uniref:hypothetical protein n=1 Tax=Mycolicibacterium goodii TaxID=134601 RepID=UPI001BDD87C9|nr:hypothetical protein [Mycolicibacterium goodii]MBU8841542.1 hypothetical protein [Mycolicibacterium goodii]